jgi:hypothetical protein
MGSPLVITGYIFGDDYQYDYDALQGITILCHDKMANKDNMVCSPGMLVLERFS